MTPQLIYSESRGMHAQIHCSNSGEASWIVSI